jgi:hypothetical protein
MSTARSFVVLAWLILAFLIVAVFADQVALFLLVYRADLISHGIENEKSIFKLVV